MAKKLSLDIAPTFKQKVSIPVPGGNPVDVEFTFKHREQPAFKEFVESLSGREDLDIVMDVASAWELDDPFDKDHVDKLIKRYMGSSRAILNVYIEESAGVRAKN
jgi:hypothetical protein